MIRLTLEQDTQIERSAADETTLLPGIITECCTTSEAESTGSQMIFCMSGDPPGCPEAPKGAQRHPKVPRGAQRYPRAPVLQHQNRPSNFSRNPRGQELCFD